MNNLLQESNFRVSRSFWGKREVLLIEFLLDARVNSSPVFVKEVKVNSPLWKTCSGVAKNALRIFQLKADEPFT